MGAVLSGTAGSRHVRESKYAEGQPSEAQKPELHKPDMSSTASSSASTLIQSYDNDSAQGGGSEDALQVTVYHGADIAVHEATTTWRESASKMLCCLSSATTYFQRSVRSQSALWGSSSALQAITRRLSRDLLGPIPQHCVDRVTVVLDLDETLVHSSFTPTDNPDFVTTIEVENTLMAVHVNTRPWLEHFLKQVVQHFEVVVFTASVEPYADAVLAHIDPQGTLHGRLYRGSCVLHGGTYVKDLSRLGRDVARTVLVDNSSASALFQPENLVLSDTWMDDPYDMGLLQILKVLMSIRECADVRLALPAAQIAAGYTT
eukprot:jgi/Ulvmu1/11125/UM071_0008.1